MTRPLRPWDEESHARDAVRRGLLALTLAAVGFLIGAFGPLLPGYLSSLRTALFDRTHGLAGVEFSATSTPAGDLLGGEGLTADVTTSPVFFPEGEDAASSTDIAPSSPEISGDPVVRVPKTGAHERRSLAIVLPVAPAIDPLPQVVPLAPGEIEHQNVPILFDRGGVYGVDATTTIPLAPVEPELEPQPEPVVPIPVTAGSLVLSEISLLRPQENGAWIEWQNLTGDALLVAGLSVTVATTTYELGSTTPALVPARGFLIVEWDAPGIPKLERLSASSTVVHLSADVPVLPTGSSGWEGSLVTLAAPDVPVVSASASCPGFCWMVDYLRQIGAPEMELGHPSSAVGPSNAWNQPYPFYRSGLLRFADEATALVRGTPGKTNSLSHIGDKDNVIRTDTTWTRADGPIVLWTGTLLVPEGVTLTIGPGTDVILYGPTRSGIVVDGTLVLNGTPDAPVRIHGMDTDSWTTYAETTPDTSFSYSGFVQVRAGGRLTASSVRWARLTQTLAVDWRASAIVATSTAEDTGEMSMGGDLSVTDSHFMLGGGSSAFSIGSGITTLRNVFLGGGATAVLSVQGSGVLDADTITLSVPGPWVTPLLVSGTASATVRHLSLDTPSTLERFASLADSARLFLVDSILRPLAQYITPGGNPTPALSVTGGTLSLLHVSLLDWPGTIIRAIGGVISGTDVTLAQDATPDTLLGPRPLLESTNADVSLVASIFRSSLRSALHPAIVNTTPATPITIRAVDWGDPRGPSTESTPDQGVGISSGIIWQDPVVPSPDPAPLDAVVPPADTPSTPQ